VIRLQVALREDDEGRVDEEAVRRAAGGEPVILSRSERDELIRVLLAAGAPPRQVAAHLEMDPDAVLAVGVSAART
jgi:hypothetical protein